MVDVTRLIAVEVPKVEVNNKSQRLSFQLGKNLDF